MSITNPPLSRTLLDYKDQAKLLLTVAGTPIDLSDARWNLTKLQVNYDGKSLAFTEIPTPSIAYPTFDNEDAVSLKMDLTNSGTLTTYFTGRIKKRGHIGRNKGESIEYVAVGTQNLANEAIVVGKTSIPNIQRFYGSTCTTITQVFTVITTTTSDGTPTYAGTVDRVRVWGTKIADAITELFSLNATRLASIGIPTTIGTITVISSISTAGTITTTSISYQYKFTGALRKDYSVSNQGFYDALKGICEHQPNRKPFFDDPTQSWIFPDLLSADITDVGINSVNILEHVYDMDTSNRWTALKYVSVVSGRHMQGIMGTALLDPEWDATLESTWTMPRATGAAANAAAGANGYQWVYRRWKLNLAPEEVNPKAPFGLVVGFKYGVAWRYARVAATVDLQNGYIYANVPVVIKGNPYKPGSAKGPTLAYFVWYRNDAAPFVAVPWMRTPEEGYEGTAYTMFGIAREKFKSVDYTQLNTENIQAELALLKDVVINANVPIEGDPIPELINLQKRLVFSFTATTGVESIAAVFTDYTYEFGSRGKSTLSLTTDMTGLVKAA